MNDELKNLKQSQAARRKNLAKWRASRLVEVKDMPSGLPGVVIRNISLVDIFLMDDVDLPNVLMEMMFDNDKKQLKKEDDAVEDQELIIDMMKNKEEFSKMLETVIGVAWVEPPIGDTADEEHITYAEIPFDDRMRIFNILSREAQDVGKFPDEPESDQATSRKRSVRAKAE